MKQTCEECEKVFASTQSLKRHMANFHPEDEDMSNEGEWWCIPTIGIIPKLAWVSDQSSDSSGEEGDEVADTVDTIGEFIKEAIEDVEDEVKSVEDLLDDDVYKKIRKAVENKVLQSASLQ